MAEEIKLLQAEFTGQGEVSGYEFKRIKENKFVYLYQVDGHFEVFRRTVNKRFGTETYPSSKRFGIDAWTIRTEEKALKKFEELTKRYKKLMKRKMK